MTYKPRQIVDSFHEDRYFEWTGNYANPITER